MRVLPLTRDDACSLIVFLPSPEENSSAHDANVSANVPVWLRIGLLFGIIYSSKSFGPMEKTVQT